jgi:hypothetical protein
MAELAAGSEEGAQPGVRINRVPGRGERAQELYDRCLSVATCEPVVLFVDPASSGLDAA